MTSLTIKTIEIHNLRSHKYFTETFPESGITHITGGNGAGKSTIVNAVPWALYGTRPADITRNLDLRREGTPKNEPTSVKVTYKVDGETYTATRTMNYRGTTQVTLEKIEDNGSTHHIAGPSVGDGTKAIIRTLGVGESIFMNTVFFRQKETDRFINSKPEVRRDIIEQLTGITANSQALEECGIHRRINKRELDSKTVDRAGLDAHRKIVADLAERELKLFESLTAQREMYRSLMAQRTALTAKVSELQQNYMTLTTAKSNLANVEERRNEAKERLKQAQKAAEELELRITGGKGVALDYQLVEAAYQKKLEALQDARVNQTTLESAIASLEDKLNRAKNTLTENNPYKSAEEAQDAHREQSEQEVQLKSAVHSLNERISIIQQAKLPEAERSYNEIANLSGTCPTCQQIIKNKEAVLKPLAETIASLKDELAEKLEAREVAQESLTALTGSIAQALDILDAYQAEKEATESLKTTKRQLTKAKRNYAKAEEEYNSALNVYNDAKEIENLTRELGNQNQVKQQMLNSIASLNDKMNSLKETITNTPNVTEHALAKAKEQLATLDKTIAENTSNGQNTNTEHTRVATEHARLATQLKQEEEDAVAYASLLLEKESIHYAEATLKEFRKAVTATAIPRLTQFASELIAGFTNGTIIGITITEEFKILAHFANGKTREVQLLSGGELSAVSLAIGLGIAKVFGGTTSTLILDEAFTAYDPRNMDATIKTIRSVMNAQQILIIAHNDTVDAVADYRVELG